MTDHTSMMDLIDKIKTGTITNFKAIFCSRLMLTMFLLGFSSGLPRMLVASTFMIWYERFGVSVESIGFLSLLTFPYTIKFIWSPLLDRFSLPYFNRRKSWIFITQILIVVSICYLALLKPDQHTMLIAIIGLSVSILSASQDIAINAYQVEVLSEEDRALAASISSLGYRLAMFCMSTVILFVVAATNWYVGFITTSTFMFIGIIGTMIAPLPSGDVDHRPATLVEAVIEPFKEFFSRDTFLSCLFIILIVILYKLGDSLAFVLNSIFFLRGLDFSLVDIAIAYKTSSLIFSLSGLVVGGLIVKKIGIYRGFLWFSLLMACANLMYLILALTGKSYVLMALAVAVEYFVGSMGSAVLVAYLFSLCDKSFSATQFALFSSIDSIGIVFIGPFAGWVADHIGWAALFTISFAVGLFTTSLIYLGRQKIIQFANLHIGVSEQETEQAKP